MNRLVLFLTASGVCLAQNGFNGPTLGLIHDEASGEIRRIAGIAGAARIVPAEGQSAVAAVHARREWVLTCSGAGQPVVFGVPGIPVKSSRLGATKIVFSETGTAAAAWFPDVLVVQIITGLPNAPSVRRELDVEFSSVDGVAVADSGVMAAVRSGSEVVVLGSDERRASIASVADVRFIERSRDLLVTTAGSVLLWRSTKDVPETLADGFEGLRAAHLAYDRKHLVAAVEKAILVRDLGTGESSDYPCQCRPSRLERLAGNGLFLISAAAGEPLWLFDADGKPPRLVFVPAKATEVRQ